MRAPDYPRDIRALTSLRYLAAAWVVFYHFANFTAAPALRDFPLVTSGYLGVDFFFVLSGFVLTHVYQPQVDAGRFDYWSFVAKRFARIYPMHLFTLACFVALGLWAARSDAAFSVWDPGFPFRGPDAGMLFRALVANLTMIHAWGSTSGLLFNLPSWSISAEWFAYLLFPVLVLIRRSPPRREGAKLVLVAALFLAMAVAVEVALNGELTRLTWNVGILRVFPEFLIGMSLHRFGERWSAGPGGAVAGLCASLVVVIAAVFGAAAAPGLAVPLAAVTVLGLSGIVFFAADADRHDRLGPAKHRFAVWLGEISYSVYMIHLGVGIVLFDLVLPGPPATGLAGALTIVSGALALTTLLSHFTYKLIEDPARRWLTVKSRELNAPVRPPEQPVHAE